MYRMERREAHAMRSPALLVTIFSYSIPSGMLRGASYIIKGLYTAYTIGVYTLMQDLRSLSRAYTRDPCEQ